MAVAMIDFAINEYSCALEDINEPLHSVSIYKHRISFLYKSIVHFYFLLAPVGVFVDFGLVYQFSSLFLVRDTIIPHVYWFVNPFLKNIFYFLVPQTIDKINIM